MQTERTAVLRQVRLSLRHHQADLLHRPPVKVAAAAQAHAKRLCAQSRSAVVWQTRVWAFGLQAQNQLAWAFGLQALLLATIPKTRAQLGLGLRPSSPETTSRNLPPQQCVVLRSLLGGGPHVQSRPQSSKCTPEDAGLSLSMSTCAQIALTSCHVPATARANAI